MSTFKGLLNHTGEDFHSFFVKDPIFEDMGLSYFTQNSLKEYIENNKKEFEKYFGDDISTTINNLTGAGEFSEEPSLMLFDLSNNSYNLSTDFLSGNTLKDIIDGNDEIQAGRLTDEAVQDIIYSVQNSLSGCITFKPKVTIFDQEQTPLVHLFLKNKNDNHNERVITNKGAPYITDTPRLPTGKKYWWQETEDVSFSGIGIFSKPQGNHNNTSPLNDITGPLRVSYNKALGCWESGSQQILAKLLTDIDAAPISNSVSYDSIDEVSNTDLFDVNSSNYMGQFKTGIAMPMTVHNGNPYTFGPNTIRETEKKERIRVVNRAPRAFKRGDTVMCSLIDSEWIIQGFDTGTTVTQKATVKIGKWSFTKLLANSDAFFKDNRCYTKGGKETKYNFNISPDQYETFIRNKFYAHMYSKGGDGASPPIVNENIKLLSEFNDLDKIAKLNLYTPSVKEDKPYYTFDKDDAKAALLSPIIPSVEYDFEPSTTYLQSTIFDQLGTHMGGNQEYNLIGRTNIHQAPDGSTNLVEYQSQIPHFWGTVFPDGYSAQQVAKLKTARKMISLTGSTRLGYVDDGGSSGFVSPNDGAEILSIDSEKNKTTDPTNFLFSNSRDSNLLQMPAEVALNGSLSGLYASPIESLPALMSAEKRANALDTYYYYFNNPSRYIWLANEADSGDIYGMSPTQPSKIQFSPLQLELATHQYAIDNPNAVGKNKYETLANSFYSYLNGVEKTVSAWANMLSRVPDSTFPFIGPDTFINAEGPIGGPDLLPDSDSAPYNDEKSNFVGIIASKNKFSAQDAITFTTKQYFGLPKVQQVTGGQAGSVTILPIGGGIGWVGPSNPSFTYGYPQWGSSEDSYRSFGTTSLRVRIFDQWPDEQTIYDPRYFSILHFNPLPMGGIVKSEKVDAGVIFDDDSWTPSKGVSNIKYERQVDKIETSVDFRIPTYAHPTDKNIDNTAAEVGTLITKDGLNNGKTLRIPSEWKVNPIRRGQLLTKGGFRYFKRVIGVERSSYYIINAGKDFTVGQIITNKDKQISIKITSINTTGGITGISLEEEDQGEGLSISDFATSHKFKNTEEQEITISGYKLNLSGQNGDTGSGSAVVFEKGILYEKVAYDPCPLESTSGPLSLTLSSNRGESASEGNKTTSVTLSNVNNPQNKYDAFYFFHNDILHTVLTPGAFIPGFGQYVELEIGAG
jgi:hypothetical protein